MFAKNLRCIKCDTVFGLVPIALCSRCGNILDVEYNYAEVFRYLSERGLGDDGVTGIWKYQALLPSALDNPISLGESDTPLHRCLHLGTQYDMESLYVKDETRQPSGSFKDRPIAVATNKALEFGVDTVVTASSGNAGAAVGAYASKAGLRCVIFVPATVPSAKLIQMSMYGGNIIGVKGSYSDAYQLAGRAAALLGWYNITTTFVSPYPTEGNKTVAYELAQQLQWDVPDWILVPIGTGPLLVGIYKGFSELRRLGLVDGMPKMIGVQALGCSPIARAYDLGHDEVSEWASPPETIASGIADQLTSYTQDGTYTLRVIRKSGGLVIAVPDQEILDAAVSLATGEGIFAEPTAAASLAAAKALRQRGVINSSDKVVCLVTGNGLKDMAAYESILVHPQVVNPDVDMHRVKDIADGEGK